MANSLVFIMIFRSTQGPSRMADMYVLVSRASLWIGAGPRDYVRSCRHDHAYFALHACRDTDHTHFLGRPAVRCAANRHAHGAVPDYIIDYRSKRTCSIGYLSRFQDFGQDFKISGEISRFRARFQDFRQYFRDFKISGKISRFQARFQDFMQDFKISCKISIETYEISRVSDPSGETAPMEAFPTRFLLPLL